MYTRHQIPTAPRPFRSVHIISFALLNATKGQIAQVNIPIYSCLSGWFSKECAAAMASLNGPLNGGRTTDSPSKQSASFACVVCHNRKVKCDRQDPSTPCSNCAKANVECIYRAPPPPRRKRDRETNGSVSQERGKYVRRSAGFDENPSVIRHHRSAEGDQWTEAGKSGSGRMIMKDGNSIYLDK